MILLAEAAEFLAFDGSESVGASAFVAISLEEPVADGLFRGFELGSAFTGRATISCQFNALLLEGLWIGWTCSWHGDLLLFLK